MPEKKKSFVLYCEYKDSVSQLSDEEKGKLFAAILEYADTGNVLELSGATAMAFSFIRYQLDINEEKYQEICEKRRRAGERRTQTLYSKC